MFDEQLRERLRKIEALYAGATTRGEKQAAGSAAERIKAKLRSAETSEHSSEHIWSLHDPWQRMLFIALCRRYGMKPYRRYRSKRQTVIVRGPRSFFDQILVPEFNALAIELHTHLRRITVSVIKDEIFDTVSEDADEVREQPRLSSS